MSQRRKSGEPQSGKKRRRADPEDEDDDAPPMSQSQGGSRGLPALADLNDKDADDVVGAVMRILLFSHTKKTPCKQAELRKEINKRCILEEVVAEARRRFRDIFGYELLQVPVDESKQPQDKPGAAKKPKRAKVSGIFILLNGAQAREAQEEEEEEGLNLVQEFNAYAPGAASRGLLAVVLGILQLSENSQIEEETLWARLARLGLRPKQIFGDEALTVQTLLSSTFVKQLYLERTKQKDGEEPIHVYRCGARARAEMAAGSLFRFISEEVMDVPVDPKALDHFLKQAR